MEKRFLKLLNKLYILLENDDVDGAKEEIETAIDEIESGLLDFESSQDLWEED